MLGLVRTFAPSAPGRRLFFLVFARCFGNGRSRRLYIFTDAIDGVAAGQDEASRKKREDCCFFHDVPFSLVK